MSKAGWREVSAAWTGEGLAFIGSNAQGGMVQMGEVNGVPGIPPMELLLVSVAGCTGMDVVHILRNKKRLPVCDVRVKVRGRRREEYPQIYVEVHVHYEIWADEPIPAKDVEQAITLSQEKYCSASAILKAVAALTHDYTLHVDAEQGEGA
jgi:putative redox protein